jgi:CDP-6-deoxy-D-xylo-4-hexulose-3-dehydrase
LDHLLKQAEANFVQVGSSSSGSSETGTGTGDLNVKIPFIKDGILTAYTGTFGDLSTQSFYPPHHLTMGEGGAVNIISRPPLKTYAESFRDWGRDCWCASGKDDTCNKRFGWQLGELPKGYDHKYIYSHLGYNLKPLDPQAAIGRQQLKKLAAFIEMRKRNWETLRVGLADLEDVFEFTLPTHAKRWLPPVERGAVQVVSSSSGTGTGNLNLSDSGTGTGNLNFSACFEWDDTGCRTDASWFGFMLRVKPSAPFSHTDLARYLDANKIGNRMFFGGNLLRQPVFVQLKKDRPQALRVVGEMTGADEIMHQAIFLGTYPGLTKEMLLHEIAVIREFVVSKKVAA